jgi:hypothetical protein
MKRIVLLLVCFCLFVCNSFADTLKLKDGKEITGNIVERSERFLKVEKNGIKFMYFFKDIDSVNGQAFGLQAAPTAAINNTVVPVNAVQTAGVTVTQEKITALNIKSETKIKIINLFIMVLVIYVFIAVCLVIVSNKTGKGKNYFAWIPIANYFLMCDIGDVQYKWLFCFLLMFLPFVGGLFFMGMTGFLWYKIAVARNHPGWVGALAGIPLLGCVAMGYIAFKD